MVEESISFYLYMAQSREDLFAILHQRYPYELAESNPECRDILEAIYNCFVDIFESPSLSPGRPTDRSILTSPPANRP